MRSTRIGLLMMVGLPCCTWSNTSKKQGGDGLSWLASWLRQKEINQHERTSIEMRCLVACLHLSGTYDQLNSPRLASMETVAPPIAQIFDAYSGEGSRANNVQPVDRGSSLRRANECYGLYRSEFSSCRLQRKPARSWILKTCAVNLHGKKWRWTTRCWGWR